MTSETGPGNKEQGETEERATPDGQVAALISKGTNM